VNIGFDSNSVLNRGTKAILRFRFGFVFKLGLVLPVSIKGKGMGSRFLISSNRGLEVDELGPFLIIVVFSFQYLFTGGGAGV